MKEWKRGREKHTGMGTRKGSTEGGGTVFLTYNVVVDGWMLYVAFLSFINNNYYSSHLINNLFLVIVWL